MQQEFEYRVKTVADVGGLRETKKALEESIKTTKEFGGATGALEAELRKVDTALGSVRGKAAAQALEMEKSIAAVRKAGGDVSGLTAARNATLKEGGLEKPGKFAEAASAFHESGGGFEGVKEAAGVFGKGALAGAAVGVAALETAREALNEYAKSEDEVFKRDQALRQRGQLTEEYKSKLDEMAESLEKATAIDNDAWTGALTTVIQAGASPKNIEATADMIKNVAGLPQYFGDVQSSAQAVSRAINGQFEAFTRMGFVIDENATLTEKLTSLQEQLATRGGGQLEGRTQTLTGHFRALSIATGEVFKSLGKGVAETGIVQNVLESLTTSAHWLAAKLNAVTGASYQTKDGIAAMSGEMETAEQMADRYQKKLDAIKRSEDEAAKKRDEASKKRAKEDQEKIDKKTDEAATALANVDLQEHLGLITPDKAKAKRQSIKNGLEDFTNQTVLGGLDRDIKARKIEEDENNAKISAAERKKDEALRMAQKSAELEHGERRVAQTYDSKIGLRTEALKEERRTSNARANPYSFGIIGNMEEAANSDPEIKKLKLEKERALAKFRNDAFHQMEAEFGREAVTTEKGARVDVTNFKKFHDVARHEEAVSKQVEQTATASNKRIGNERAELEDDKRQKGAHFERQAVTRRTTDLTERLPEGSAQPDSGTAVDQRLAMDQQRIAQIVRGAGGRDRGENLMRMFEQAIQQNQAQLNLAEKMQNTTGNMLGKVRTLEANQRRIDTDMEQLRQWMRNGGGR